MKTAFDFGSRLFIMGLLALTVWVTIFNGDVAVLKQNVLSKAPGLATTISVMLPTATVRATSVIGDAIKLRTPMPVVITSNGEIIAQELPDCSTVETTVPCELVPTAMPSPTVYMGPKPVFDTGEDPETGEMPLPDPPLEPVLAQAPMPIKAVLRVTADYRSDCHAMFASREDKSGWAADIAACEATGDYK